MTDFSVWTHHTSVTITGSTDGALTNYPVPVTVAYQSFMNTDFNDIRFTLSNGTELNYSLESYTASSSANFLVKIPSLPASPGTVTIVVYAGNPNITTTSDPSSVCETYDDFDDNTLNKSIWTENNPVGTIVESNGTLQISVPANTSADWWGSTYGTPILYTSTPSGDWVATVKLISRTRVGNSNAGLFIMNGYGNYYHLVNIDWPSNWGDGLEVMNSVSGNASEVTHNNITNQPIWLQISCINGTYKFSYSTTGTDDSYTTLYSTSSLGFTPANIGLIEKTWGNNAVTAIFDNFKILQTTPNPPTIGTIREWTENSLIISTPPIQSILTVKPPQIALGGGVRITAPPIGLTSSINIPTLRAILTSPPLTAVSSIIPPVIAFLMEVKAGVTYNPDAINDLKQDGVPCNISFNVTIGGQQYE